MARQPVVAGRAEQLLGAAVVATAPVAGGDISTAVKLRLSSGRSAFLKTLSPAPPQFFAREAACLRWLAEATASGGVATPEVLAVDTDCLILDWVEAGRPTAEAAGSFGRALAATHAYGATGFGADSDGYIGGCPCRTAPCRPGRSSTPSGGSRRTSRCCATRTSSAPRTPR